MTTPSELWQCKTPKEQLAWCIQRWDVGKTLSDTGLWLGGAAPETIVRNARRHYKKQGLKLNLVYVAQRDAAGKLHPKIPAWKLEVKRDEA